MLFFINVLCFVNSTLDDVKGIVSKCKNLAISQKRRKIYDSRVGFPPGQIITKKFNYITVD